MQVNLYTNTTAFLNGTNVLTNYDYDIDFYKHFSNPNTNILELGCNTGRTTLSLINACDHIIGTEKSKSKLRIIQDKIYELDPIQQEHVHVVNADMSNFELNQSFELILFPGTSFQSLITDEQRISCLECVKNHLAEGGKIIIDLMDPHFENNVIGKPLLDYEYFEPDLKCTVKKYTLIKEHDRKRQTQNIEYIFELVRGNERIDSFEDDFEISYLYEEQATELFTKCGLKIQSSFGWYDFSPIDKEHKRMLIYILELEDKNE